MKLSLGKGFNDQPQLRHWLVIALVLVVLIVTLFAWNSAAHAFG
jgi:hypothetical protein